MVDRSPTEIVRGNVRLTLQPVDGPADPAQFQRLLDHYPKAAPDTARRDAWPPGGGLPGSDLAFMQAQHLDPNNVAYGILTPLRLNGGAARNTDLGAALCTALNEWQVEHWVRRDARLRAGITVAHEDPESAVVEIERRAGDPNFVQVQLPSKMVEPLGRKRY